MWTPRRLLRIFWTRHMPNEEILLQQTLIIVECNQTWKTSYLGTHVSFKKIVLKIGKILTGKIK